MERQDQPPTGPADEGAVQTVTGEAALRALAPGWRALFAAAGEPSPFLSWEWAESWLDAWGAWDHAVVVVWAEEEAAAGAGREAPAAPLRALLPLVRDRGRWAGLIPHRRLRFVGDGSACPDHMDLLCRPGLEAVAAARVVESLTTPAGSPAWDGLWLDGLAEGSVLPRAFAARRDVTVVCLPGHPIRVLPLPDTWEAYLAALPAKRRGRQGWRERRMAKEAGAPVVFETLTDSADLAPTLEALIALHQKVQEGRGNPGSFATPDMRRLITLLAERTLARGWLRLTGLRVGSAVVAVIFCLHCGGRTFFYTLGHDPAWARHNPGRLVMARSLRQAIEDGARVYDFLRGEEAYKAALTDQVVWNRRVVVGRGWGQGSAARLHGAVKSLRRRMRAGMRRALAGAPWHRRGAEPPAPRSREADRG